MMNLKIKVENLKGVVTSLSNKVEKSLELLKKEPTTNELIENQIQACKGLISLTNENSFCDVLAKLGGLSIIKSRLETHKPDQVSKSVFKKFLSILL